MYPWYWRLIRIFPLINKNKIDSIYIAVPWIKLTLIDLACRVLFRQSCKQSRPCRGPFLEGPEKFSHSKISNLIVTELFCSIFLLVIWTEVPFIPEGSRSFRRIHFSVFRYSWIKNGIIGVCLVGGSSEGSPFPGGRETTFVSSYREVRKIDGSRNCTVCILSASVQWITYFLGIDLRLSDTSKNISAILSGKVLTPLSFLQKMALLYQNVAIRGMKMNDLFHKRNKIYNNIHLLFDPNVQLTFFRLQHVITRT